MDRPVRHRTDGALSVICAIARRRHMNQTTLSLMDAERTAPAAVNPRIESIQHSDAPVWLMRGRIPGLDALAERGTIDPRGWSVHSISDRPFRAAMASFRRPWVCRRGHVLCHQRVSHHLAALPRKSPHRRHQPQGLLLPAGGFAFCRPISSFSRRFSSPLGSAGNTSHKATGSRRSRTR